MRRIAAAYGVSYDTFLRHALGRTGRGARDLDHASEETLERLAESAGVSLERLRGMRSGAIMARTDTASGAKAERIGLDEALSYVRPGDTLVVWRLDRLGRSLPLPLSCGC